MYCKLGSNFCSKYKCTKFNLLEQESTGISGHYGRGGSRGKEVDDIFAGPFKGSNNVISVLQKQINDRKMKRNWMIQSTDGDVGHESPLGGYFNINTDALIDTYKFWEEDKIRKDKFNKEVTPLNKSTWEYLESNYMVDDSDKITKDFPPKYEIGGEYITYDKFLEKFKNDSGTYKAIGENK